VGSLNEKMDQKLNRTGLAHLFEHMMFRGTKKYPDGKFDELTSRLGSDKQNATTYYYRTNYFESVPAYQLDKIMELESDRMANLILDGELLEKEKGAVVGEFRRAMDNPNRLAWDELMRLVYTESPFRFTVLGTEEEIKEYERSMKTELYDKVRLASEVHRQVRSSAQSFIEPGIKLVDMCERLEECNRRLINIILYTCNTNN
jgi:zinc protease